MRVCLLFSISALPDSNPRLGYHPSFLFCASVSSCSFAQQSAHEAEFTEPLERADIQSCAALPRGTVPMSLCGYSPSQIMAMASRALQFWEGQQNLNRETLDHHRGELEKKCAKFKSQMQELQTNQISAINVLQARNQALQKELEAERTTTRSVQARLHHESTQKRRLEEECHSLEQRRWLRQSFVASSQSVMKPKALIAPAQPAQPAPPGPASQEVLLGATSGARQARTSGQYQGSRSRPDAVISAGGEVSQRNGADPLRPEQRFSLDPPK